MGRPRSLLEGLCEHALSFGAESVEVRRQDGCERVFAGTGPTSFRIANYPSRSSDAKELQENLSSARKKPLRTVLCGRVFLLELRPSDSEHTIHVDFKQAPPLDPSVAPSFTAKQGQYMAFIQNYTKLHRQAPAETDFQRYFQVSPPSVHEMIKTLERKGFIQRTPGEGRTIRLLVSPVHLPPLT